MNESFCRMREKRKKGEEKKIETDDKGGKGKRMLYLNFMTGDLHLKINQNFYLLPFFMNCIQSNIEIQVRFLVKPICPPTLEQGAM